MFDPFDFFKVSRDIYNHSKTKSEYKEAFFRSAISRAYYSIYHSYKEF